MTIVIVLITFSSVTVQRHEGGERAQFGCTNAREVVSNSRLHKLSRHWSGNIFERHTYVTKSKPGVFLDGTICQLEGRLTPPWGKLFTSGKKECVSFSWNFNISKNLKKNFLGVPYL